MGTLQLKFVKTDNREWYGYGFVAGETMFVQKVIGGQVIGMHNGFLSAFVGTGYIGLLFFSLFILGYARSVFFSPIPKQYKGFVDGHILLCICSYTRKSWTWIPSIWNMDASYVLCTANCWTKH